MSSRKIKRLIAAMAALLVLAAGGYMAANYILNQKESAQKAEEESLNLFSFSSENVQTITLDTRDGHFQFDRNGGTWELTDTDYSYSFASNSYYLSAVCANMAELSAEKKFDTQGADLSVYGLDDPVVLDCFDGFAHNTLYIGSPSATQEYYYVMVPDNDTVYGISYESGIVLHGDLTNLKNPYLIDANDVDITHFRLEHNGKTAFDLQSSDGQWELKEPLPDARLDVSQVKSMLTAVVRLELDSYVELKNESTDLKDYGLDDPDYTLTVGKTDGTEMVLDFAENGDSYYVYYESTGEIAAASSPTFLKTDISELLDASITDIHAQDIVSLDVKVQETAFRMELDTDNKQYKLDDTDIDALGSDAVSLFSSLYNTVANLKYESLDIDAVPDLTKEAAVSFRYTMKDGSVQELRLIEKEENLYYAVWNDKYTGMLVRQRALSDSTGVLTYYEKMTDLIEELS